MIVGTHLSRSTSLNTMPAFFPPSCEEKGKQNSTCSKILYNIINSGLYFVLSILPLLSEMFFGGSYTV